MKLVSSKKRDHLFSAICVMCFSVYPVLAVYAHNAEQLRFNQLLLPLAASLPIAGLFFITWYFIFRNHIKACISTALLLVIFWNYSLLFSFFTGFVEMGNRHFLPVLLIVYLVIVLLISQRADKIALRNIRTIMLIPIVLLVVLNFFLVTYAEIKKLKPAAVRDKLTDLPEQKISENPDLYILIFDEYASIITMQELWGYDNNAFAEKLEDKGFFFAHTSKTRYDHTLLAIPSILDLQYLEPDISRRESLETYNHNRTFQHLNQLDYRIHFLDGWGGFEYTFDIPVADFLCLYNTNIEPLYKIDEFTYLVFRRSMLTFLTNRLIYDNANLYFHGHHYFLNYIRNFPNRTNKSENPLLLYGHVMAPHLPFVFDRYGNFNENPTNYWEYKSLPVETLRELYLEQYIFITDQIIDVVNTILKNSDREPVIALFSDHGPRLGNGGPAEKEHRYRVLNAVYFPEGDYSALNDNIAPVNTMRVIFNTYFGTSYEMLDDI